LRKRDLGAETLSESVYESLKKEILSLDIKPGTILTENDVSEAYKISRSPVRSVFQKLKEDGLVTAIPYKLSYVSQLDMNRILDVIYLRISVESAIMRDFILLDDKKAIRKMERNMEDQKEMIEEGVDPKAFGELDAEFHKMMYRTLGKMGVWDIIQKVELSYNRFKLLDLVAASRFQQIYEDHEVFMKIIHEKRIDEIEKAYAIHLYSGIRRLRGFIFDEYPDYFTDDLDELCLNKIDRLLEETYGRINSDQ